MSNRPILVYTLTADDARNQRVHILDPSGHKHWLWSFFGPVTTRDVGKRVYAVLADDREQYVLQVENDAQLAVRQNKED